MIGVESLLDEEQLVAFKQYEIDLHIYNQCNNRIVRDAVAKKILDKYKSILGFTLTDINNHAALLATPEEEDVEERKVYNLKDLLSIQTSIPTWLVPNLIADGGGLYMVAGSPKAGKTRIFTYNLAYSVMFTGEFLGFPCGMGRVLIFECEESVAKVARTFRTKGLNQFNENIKEALNQNLLRLESNFAIDSDIKYLQAVIREFQPRLVIYDSLRAITKHLGISENSVEISKYVYTLQKVHNFLGVPGLLIHHMSKGGKERGIEGVAGSLSLTGATDGIFRLYKAQDKNGHSVELITDPREGLPVHWLLSLSKPKGSYWKYKIEKDFAVDLNQLLLEKRILSFLASKPEILFSRSQIATALRVEESLVDSAVNRLIDSLQITEEHTEDGFKVWISQSSPWVQAQGTIQYEIFSYADQLSIVDTVEELEQLTENWDSSLKRQVWNSLPSEVQKRLLDLRAQPKPKFEVGSWVRDTNTQELHQIREKEYKDQWMYTVENGNVLKESELESSEEYDFAVNF